MSTDDDSEETPNMQPNMQWVVWVDFLFIEERLQQK